MQVRGEYPDFAFKFFRDNGIDTSFILEGDTDILKEGTVDMYTFSYYQSGCITEDPEAEMVAGNMVKNAKNPLARQISEAASHGR